MCIDLIENYITKTLKYICRKCDTKNINASPLCALSGGQDPPLWQEDVANTYSAVNGALPPYVKV